MLRTHPGGCEGAPLVVTAYLDDSGTSPGNDVICCGGLVSTVYRWKHFERAWEAVRNIKGDEFKFMHIAECVANNDKSEFRNWDLAKKTRVLQRLRGVAKRHSMRAFGIGLHKNDYLNEVPENLKAKLGSHFTFSVLCTLSLIGRWRRNNNISAPIEYVFDFMEPKDIARQELEEVFHNTCERGEALTLYGMTKDGYSFRSKERVVPLQAADMIAWSLFNATTHSLGVKNANLLATETWNDFVKHKKHQWMDSGYTSREQIREFVSKTPDSPVLASIKDITCKPSSRNSRRASARSSKQIPAS